MGPLVVADPALALAPLAADPLELLEVFEPVEEPELPPGPAEPPDPPDPPDDGDGLGGGDGEVESAIVGRGVTLGTGDGPDIEAADAPVAFPPINARIGGGASRVHAVGKQRR